MWHEPQSCGGEGDLDRALELAAGQLPPSGLVPARFGRRASILQGAGGGRGVFGFPLGLVGSVEREQALGAPARGRAPRAHASPRQPIAGGPDFPGTAREAP